MNEKRFMIEKSSIVEDGFFICDNTGTFSFPTTKDKSELIMYVKHLNELHEEIQALKLELELSKPLFSRRELETKLKEQHEENEQLKQAYTQLKHRHSLLHDACIDAECDRDSYRKDIASLEKENEQLRNNIKEAYENERTALGRSVLKQLIDKME